MVRTRSVHAALQTAEAGHQLDTCKQEESEKTQTYLETNTARETWEENLDQQNVKALAENTSAWRNFDADLSTTWGPNRAK